MDRPPRQQPFCVTPSVKLLIGILLICALAAAVTGCAGKPKDWLGGFGFDLAGAAIQGIAGN
jgi:hypothetical protein